uniref:hypothetical protein n=1 Tax=uncultured Phascolarctobacterium sp. TaxID=512296 RepID=UPI002620765A
SPRKIFSYLSCLLDKGLIREAELGAFFVGSQRGLEAENKFMYSFLLSVFLSSEYGIIYYI